MDGVNEPVTVGVVIPAIGGVCIIDLCAFAPLIYGVMCTMPRSGILAPSQYPSYPHPTVLQYWPFQHGDSKSSAQALLLKRCGASPCCGSTRNFRIPYVGARPARSKEHPRPSYSHRARKALRGLRTCISFVPSDIYQNSACWTQARKK